MSSQQTLQVGRPSNSLHFIVGEMSGKLDQVLLALIDDRRRTSERFEDHGRRLDVLERWRWKLVGGVSLIVFASGVVEVWFNVAKR